jgi:hypothetical protein
MPVPGHVYLESSLTDDPIARLHRSGWHMSVKSVTDTSDRTGWEIAGHLGENRFAVEGATREEAWQKAVLAAAACGMLHGYWRPPTGRE